MPVCVCVYAERERERDVRAIYLYAYVSSTHMRARPVPYRNSQFARAFTFEFPLFTFRIVVVYSGTKVPFDEEVSLNQETFEKAISHYQVVQKSLIT